MSTFSSRRAAVLLFAIATLLISMIGRVAWLQTYGRQATIQWVDRQQHTSDWILARRGTMFDRNGNPLAATVETLTLFADPKFMLREYQSPGRNLNQMDEDLKKLARLVDVNPDLLTQRLGENPDARYLKLAADLDAKARKAIDDLKIPGLGFSPTPVRWYPMGALASHVIGMVGKDGEGLEGIEKQFDQTLSGRNGYRRVEKDASRRILGMEADDYIPPIHGKHVVLTIDSNIQMLAEEELLKACEAVHAERGEAIVMDPRTGEILALANYPTFNPQNASEAPPEIRRNSCLVMPYEPGSTIKPFIVGPALSWHVTNPAEMWAIPGISYNPYGSRTVTDVHYYGPLCTWDVLVKSDNIGMVMMGQRMGNTRLHKALTLFGFGQPTGIELPGENAGRVYPVKKWGMGSTVSVPQGYEMMVTPLQITRAFCVYANGGRLPKARLVKGLLDTDANTIPHKPYADPDSLPQVLDEASALATRQILSDVVVRGTAQGKASKYWNIFGKTGTAHIAKRGGGYDPIAFNSSFICGAPLENPKIVVSMIIHKPDKGIAHYGGAVSAPGAIRLVERTLGYMQVPASPPLSPPPSNVAQHLHNFNPRLYLQETAASQ